MSSSPAAIRIGVILGSARPAGNGVGVQAWFVSHLSRAASSSSTPVALVELRPSMAELGPIVADIPASVQSGAYSSPAVRAWSAAVASCSAFVVVTPQHNWGYPAEIKLAIDHLYHEWTAKPIAVVTYGGHGGGKCGAQLRQVLDGLHMRVVSEELAITLPGDHIRGAKRAQREGPWTDTFLSDYDGGAEKVSTALIALLHTPAAAPA